MIANPEKGAKIAPSRQALSEIVLSTGFSLTGAGTVLLGVLLPVFSRRWALRDDQAGLLLFLQFFGSALGAVFTGLQRIRSMAIGYGLLAVTACMLAFTNVRAPYAIFFFFGLGLGMAMTSTSLLFSDRCGDDRAAKLVWLNFSWSVGATIGPLCSLPFLHRDDVRSLFMVMLVLSLAMLAWVVVMERDTLPAALQRRSRPMERASRRTFALLLILTMTAVGVETSLSGWLTTFSQRAGMHNLAGAALATSIFWLGEMISRLVFSTRLLAKAGSQQVLRWGVRGVTVAAVAVIVAPHPWLILVAAGMAGVFIGPIYPLSLSYLLELSPRGWLFAMSGMGAALFPWMTGIVSEYDHSLRSGLVVPCFAGLTMAVLNWLIFGAATGKCLASPARRDPARQ
jgi:MFS transporter, FHS family, glucose/mannose:H+ symporter